MNPTLPLLLLLLVTPTFAADNSPPEKAGISKSVSPQAGAALPAMKIGGTGVTLIPPAGFRQAERFLGVQHDESGSSIMVTEIPVNYRKMSGGFTVDGLATKGMELLERENILAEGRPALLMRIRQEAHGRKFLKWIALFGNASTTVMVTASFPESTAGSLDGPLKEAVLSTRWQAREKKGDLEGLPYRLDPPPGLVLATRLQNDLLFARDGSVPQNNPDDPILVVGYSISAVSVADLPAFARSRLEQTANLQEISIESEKDLSSGGMKGREILATGTDSRSGSGTFMYQLVLTEPGGGYYIVQGFTGRSDRAAFEEPFRKAALSLRRR